MFQPQLVQILSKFLILAVFIGASQKRHPLNITHQNMSNPKETTQQRAHVVALDGSEDADKAFLWALRNLVKCPLHLRTTLSLFSPPRFRRAAQER
jgi:hypothetical protein